MNRFPQHNHAAFNFLKNIADCQRRGLFPNSTVQEKIEKKMKSKSPVPVLREMLCEKKLNNNIKCYDFSTYQSNESKVFYRLV